MSFEEYAASRHPTPYTFSIQSGSSCLYYFGERHSYDPTHEEWDIEKKFWQSFLNDTEGKKRMVFVEGTRRTSAADEASAILNDGGMGLITYLAHQENIDTYCPEPDRTYERSELLKHFSKEESQYYYFARIVGQWNKRQEPRPDFEEYINDFLQKDKRTTGWTDFDFSIEHMKKIHTALFHKEFDKNDVKFFNTICRPTEAGTVINNVAQISCKIRDTYIVQQIQRYLAEGYSIYVQFGATHAVMQEPLLRELVK